MSIIRAPRPESGFLMAQNEVLRDLRISYKALGLLLHMLSHQDNWRFASADLARAGHEGRDAVRSAMRELEQAGYLRTVQGRDDHGRITRHTYVYDTSNKADYPGPGNTALVDVYEAPGPDYPAPVTPALLEDHQKKTIEDQEPRNEVAPVENPPDVAQEIAATFYEENQRMGNFMAIKAVVKKALNAGYEPDAVLDALRRADEDGRPLTAQVIKHYLTGTAYRGRSRERQEQNDRVTEFARLLTEQKQRKEIQG